MPPPLTSDGQVTYAPTATKPTVDQMAKDVVGVPGVDGRAQAREPPRGRASRSSIFLLFATVLGYLAYQNIWAEAKRKVRRDRGARPEEPGEDPPRQGQGRRHRLGARRSELAVQRPIHGRRERISLRITPLFWRLYHACSKSSSRGARNGRAASRSAAAPTATILTATAAVTAATAITALSAATAIRVSATAVMAATAVTAATATATARRSAGTRSYYYPGTGIYVYDRYRNRHRWSDSQRRYWGDRNRRWRDHSTSTGTHDDFGRSARELERVQPQPQHRLVRHEHDSDRFALERRHEHAGELASTQQRKPQSDEPRRSRSRPRRLSGFSLRCRRRRRPAAGAGSGRSR